jgi:hypothetical protein
LHREGLVFRTAMKEANGDVEEALKRLGPACCDTQGNLVRLTLNRTIARTGKAIGQPPYQLDNSVLSHVKKVVSIHFLALGHSTWINDTGMKQIAAMKNLQCLSMKHTEISSDGLDHLQSAKSLRVLVVCDKTISEADAIAFEKAKPDCEVIRWPTDAGPNAAALTSEHERFIQNVKAGRLVQVGEHHH